MMRQLVVSWQRRNTDGLVEAESVAPEPVSVPTAYESPWIRWL